MNRVALAAALLLSVAVPPSARALEDGAYTFIYSMRMGGVSVGTVTDTLILEGGSYRIESRAVAEGIAAVVFGKEFVRTSEGTYDPERGLRPLGYRQAYGDSDERTARFDWEAGTLSLDWPGGEREVALEPGEGSYHDRLSFLYQPFASCAAAPGTYRVADGKRLSEYRYETGEEDPAPSPLGEVGTVRLERIAEGKSSVLRLARERSLAPLSFTSAGGGGYSFSLLEADGVPEGACPR